MEILKGNQDILSNQIKQTYTFSSLTYVKQTLIDYCSNDYKKILSK